MNKEPIHDYDLYDEDFDEWQRRGLEAFGIEVKETEAA
jgi:hypothetical protein